MAINKTALTEAKRKRRKNKLPCDSISYTTGDIALNIGRFNQAMGTDSRAIGEGDTGGSGALCEAKRYVRRYLAKPMNKFCSNKAEVLKLLVDIGDQNCTIYTLNNLEDNEKDISKLSSRDIIYTYDNGILKDKNGVRVLDYDLSIKKEENRKKISNPDPKSKEFKAEYEDRMTAATELEEAFNLDFEDINAFGEKLTEAKENFCCICGEPIEGYGNNPEPHMSADEGRACDGCNLKFVIPARLRFMEEE